MSGLLHGGESGPEAGGGIVGEGLECSVGHQLARIHGTNLRA
jgi:hypothetical protein